MRLVHTTAWAEQMWAMLADRGTWTIPRSGLVFTKHEAERHLVLTHTLHWQEGMPVTRERLRRIQAEEYVGMEDVFGEIGVTVVDGSHSRKVRENEGPGT